MIQFFQTQMGKRFYESTMPALAKQLERLNVNLERLAQTCGGSGAGGSTNPAGGGTVSSSNNDPSLCKRAAIYTRLAVRDDRDSGAIELQRVMCEHFVREKGWEVSGERYDDVGYSGLQIDRPALTRLLSDADAKKVNVIVVPRLDRLSGAFPDCARILDQFHAAGSIVAVANGHVVIDSETLTTWKSFL